MKRRSQIPSYSAVLAKEPEASGGSSGTNVSAALRVLTERQAWFTPETLAAYLQVSDRQVRKWVNDGRLVSYKFGASRRFDPADADAFVAQFRDEREPKG